MGWRSSREHCSASLIWRRRLHCSGLPPANTLRQPAARTRLRSTAPSCLGLPLAAFSTVSGALYHFSPTRSRMRVSALSLFWIQVPFQEERTGEIDQPLRKEISDGLTWLWRHALLRSLALLSGSANLVLAAFPLVLILLAQRLHASAPLTGVVLTGAGAGGVLGSLVYLRLQQSVGFGWLFLGGLGLALLMWLVAAIAPTPLFLAAVALCAMASEQVSSVAQYTVRLALIPDHLRGRVNSAYRLLLMLTQPIGIAGVGFLVQRMGTGSTILVCALVLGVTLAAGLGVPSLRAVGTYTGVAPRDRAATTDTSTADMPLPRASSPETVTETVLATCARRQEIGVAIDDASVPPRASTNRPGHPVDQARGDRRRTRAHQSTAKTTCSPKESSSRQASPTPQKRRSNTQGKIRPLQKSARKL